MEIEILKNSLLIDKNILVFGDVHIGFEEQIISKGLINGIQFKEIKKDILDIFKLLKNKKIKLKKIIILGDLKHEFGIISKSEIRETNEFIKILKKNAKEIILIRGNHDILIKPFFEKIKIKEYYKYKEVCFLHGHKKNEKCIENSKILILGHLHPAILLENKYKKEKYKCFLYGVWKKKKVYVLPSFSNISFGYNVKNILDSKNKSFLIIPNKSLKNFNVLIYVEYKDIKKNKKSNENNYKNEVLNFGKIKNLKIIDV